MVVLVVLLPNKIKIIYNRLFKLIEEHTVYKFQPQYFNNN